MRKPLSYLALVIAVIAIPCAAILTAGATGKILVACVKTDGTVDGVLRTSTSRACPHAGDVFAQWSVSSPSKAPPSTPTTGHATSTASSIPATTSTMAPVTTGIFTGTTTTQPSGSDPSGASPPVGDTPGWHQVCLEDFTKTAPLGSWATQDASKVVYTGANGCKWTEYPDGWSSTNTGSAPGYEPGQVLSVHDSVLDFALHPIGGHAEGANPSPLLPTASNVTYGKFIVRMRMDHVAGYHDAFLLWPSNDNDWQSAESDFPEMDLTDSTVSAYAHFGGSGSQDAFEGTKVDLTQWHTYEQDWSPGKRTYLVDGVVIGTSTSQVYSGPEHWQFQTEPSSTAAGGTGHQLIDWAVAYVAG